MSDVVWENKKIERHSKKYYEWLIKVMEKRNLNHIWVIFYKNKNKSLYGEFKKDGCIEMLNTLNGGNYDKRKI